MKTGPVGVIGTGKAACFVLRGCLAAGVPVAGVWGRRNTVASQLGECWQVRSFATTDSLVDRAALIVIAVRDSAIHEMATRLAVSGRPVLEHPLAGKVFAHLSGLLDDSVLEPLARSGAVCGSLHPLMTLHENSPTTGVHFFAQSRDERFFPAVLPLVEKTGNLMHRLEPSTKTVYHTAATMLCQGISASIEAARMLLKDLDDKLFREAFGPLAAETVAERMRGFDPSTLTGPAVRGDVEVGRRHREAALILPHGRVLADLYDAIGHMLETVRMPVPPSLDRCGRTGKGCPEP